MTEDLKTAVAPSGEPILRTMFPGDLPDNFLRPLPDGITAYQLWKIHKRKQDLRKEYLDYWASTLQTTGTGRPVDAIISPAAPFAAPPHGLNSFVPDLYLVSGLADRRKLSSDMNYTNVWNVLDYPATVFPVTTVDPAVDVKKAPHVFISKADKRVYELCSSLMPVCKAHPN